MMKSCFINMCDSGDFRLQSLLGDASGAVHLLNSLTQESDQVSRNEELHRLSNLVFRKLIFFAIFNHFDCDN